MTEPLKIAEGLATVVIAIYVASIGTFQWFTAREKLRLDLYNRRFDVYLNSVQFMQNVVDGEIAAVEIRLADYRAFIRAVRESRFLFAEDKRIFELLEEVNKRAFRIAEFRKQDHTAQSLYNNEMHRQRYAEHQSQIDWIEGAPIRLEALLLPYLGFRHRQFKTLFRRRRS